MEDLAPLGALGYALGDQRRCALGVLAVEDYLALARQDAVDGAEGRRFSGPVRADERDHFASLPSARSPYGVYVTVVAVHVLDLEQGHGFYPFCAVGFNAGRPSMLSAFLRAR